MERDQSFLLITSKNEIFYSCLFMNQTFQYQSLIKVIRIFAQISMKKIVKQSPFPQNKYQLVEHLPQRQNCLVSRYKYGKDQRDYIIYEYTFNQQMPPRIKKKIKEELQVHSQYSQNQINRVNRCYFNECSTGIKIRLRTDRHKSKTLEKAIISSLYKAQIRQEIQNMRRISLTLKKMHQRNHYHGLINLSNIYYKKSKSKLILGTPCFHQIQKWINKNKINSQILFQINKSSSFYDIHSLGFVFLQMTLRTKLPQNITVNFILSDCFPKIHHQNIKHLLMKMLLGDKEKQNNLYDIINILQRMNAHQIYMNIGIEQQAKSILKFSTFSLQNYQSKRESIMKDNKYTEIIVRNNSSQNQIVFFLNEKSLLISIYNKRYFLIDLTKDYLQMQSLYGWFRCQTFSFIIEEKETKLKFKSDGLLQIEVTSLTIKQIIEKQRIEDQNKRKQRIILVDSKIFNNVAQIKGSILRKGLILTERIMITPIYNIQELRANQEKLFFLCEGLRGKSKNYQCWFTEEELQDNQLPELQYCLIDFHVQITLAEFNRYLKVVRNYNEAIIEEKIKKFPQVDFNYQLGKVGLKKGKILFQKNSFLIDINENVSIGQPLILNFSSNCSVVIGIYVGSRQGMLFDDQFCWSIYKMILRCRTLSEAQTMFLPFVIIQCSNLRVEQQQLISLNFPSLNSFLTNNSITLSSLEQLILTTQQKEVNLKTLGFYHFCMIKLLNKNEHQLILFHLQKANQFLSKYYQHDNITKAVVIYHITSQMLSIYTDQLEIIQIKSFRYSIHSILKEYQNPFLQLLIHNDQNCISHYDLVQSGQFFLQHQLLARKLQIHLYLLKIYQRIVASLRNNQSYLFVVLQNEFKMAEIEQKRRNNKKHIQYFEKRIKRLQRSIRQHRFAKVNDYLEELFALNRSEEYLNEQKQRKIQQIWKSTLVAIVLSGNNLLELKQFEQISKKYYEEGYINTKDSFRKKQAMINNNNLLLL